MNSPLETQKDSKELFAKSLEILEGNDDSSLSPLEGRPESLTQGGGGGFLVPFDDEAQPPPPKKYQKANDLIQEARSYLNPADMLTERQRKFLEAWVSNGGNLTKAVEKAGYSKTAYLNCRNLLKQEKAIEYIKMIKEQGFQEASCTVSEIVTMARTVFNEALKDAEYKACMDSVRFLGQYMGMMVDRKETTTREYTHVSGDGIKDVQDDNAKFEKILSKLTGSKVIDVTPKKPKKPKGEA